jgi:hypothetical protein
MYVGVGSLKKSKDLRKKDPTRLVNFGLSFSDLFSSSREYVLDDSVVNTQILTTLFFPG